MYISDGGGGGDTSKDVTTGAMGAGLHGVMESVHTLKAAQANGVKLDPDSAATLVTAINNAIREVNDSLADRGVHIQDSVKIGTTPAATVYTPVYQNVINDPVQGGEKALEKLRDELKDARDTVKACVRDIEDTDEGSAGNFTGIPI